MPPKRETQANKESPQKKPAKQPDTQDLETPGKQVELVATLERAKAAPRSLNPREVLQLQRLVGNQAAQVYLNLAPRNAAGPVEEASKNAPPSHPSGNTVQRLILHDHYQSPNSESVTAIKDELETQETIEHLKASTGQQADLYGGNKPVDHQPKENYLISHGLGGLAMSYIDTSSLAQNLVARGIQSKDILRLITCQVGQPHGDAEGLANELGAKGVEGVIIHAPTGYINWNVDGPVVVSEYPLGNKELNKAQKIWTKAEDKGFEDFIKSFKGSIIQLIDSVVQQNREKGLQGLLDPIIQAEPGKEKGEHLARLAEALQEITLAKKSDIYKFVISKLRQAEIKVSANDPTFRQERTNAQNKFRDQLKQVLQALHGLLGPDPIKSNQAYEADIAKARNGLRQALANAWPGYSKAYFGILRQKYHNPDLWRMLKSTRPAVLPASTNTSTSSTTTATSATTTNLTNLDFDVDAFLAELTGTPANTNNPTTTATANTPAPANTNNPTTATANTNNPTVTATSTISDEELDRLLDQLADQTPEETQDEGGY